jgi:hypothetical protein
LAGKRDILWERQVRHAKENLYNRTNHQLAEKSRSANQPVWCKYSIRGNSSGPGGIRTRDFFSAIDKQVGEKGGKVVYCVYFVSKSPYCDSISVLELFPQYEARKGDP